MFAEVSYGSPSTHASIWDGNEWTGKGEWVKAEDALAIESERDAALEKYDTMYNLCEQVEAERDALRVSAKWVLHAFNDVSKAGGPTQDGEHEAALKALQAAYSGTGEVGE